MPLFLGSGLRAWCYIHRKSISTRTTRTPSFWGYPPPPHDYPYHWVILDPKWKEDKVKVTNLKNSPKFLNGHYTRHTFWSCLIRCANMKWIRWVLLKIQSGHDSVHRRTDGQGDTSIPPYQLRWSGGYNNVHDETIQHWHSYPSIFQPFPGHFQKELSTWCFYAWMERVNYLMLLLTEGVKYLMLFRRQINQFSSNKLECLSAPFT